MLNMHIASLSWSFFLKTKLFHINVVYCELKIISIHTASRNVQKLSSWAPHNHIQKNMKYSGVFLCFSLPQPLPGLAQSEGRHPTPSSSFKTERKGLNWLAPLWLVWGRPEGLASVSCLGARAGTVAWGESGGLRGVAPAGTGDSWRSLQTCRHLGKRREAGGGNRNGTLTALSRSQGETDKPQRLPGATYTIGLGEPTCKPSEDVRTENAWDDLKPLLGWQLVVFPCKKPVFKFTGRYGCFFKCSIINRTLQGI